MKRYIPGNPIGEIENLQKPNGACLFLGATNLLLDLTVPEGCTLQVIENFKVVYDAFAAAQPQHIVMTVLEQLNTTIKPLIENLTIYVMEVAVGVMFALFILAVIGFVVSILLIQFSVYWSLLVGVIVIILGMAFAYGAYRSAYTEFNAFYVAIVVIYEDLIIEMEAYETDYILALEEGLCAYPTHIPCPSFNAI